MQVQLINTEGYLRRQSAYLTDKKMLNLACYEFLCACGTYVLYCAFAIFLEAHFRF